MEIVAADDRAGGAGLGHDRERFVELPAPEIVETMLLRVVVVAHDPCNAVPEFGMLVQETGEFRGLRARADEQHQPEVLPGAAPIREPCPVAAAHHDDEQQREHRADGDLSRRQEGSPHGREHEPEQGHHDTSAGNPHVLHGTKVADPGPVEARHGERREPPGHQDNDQDDGLER